MKAAIEWTDAWRDAFGRLCAERWGFRYSPDDAFTLRDIVERAYQASDAPSLAAFAEQLGALPDSDPEVQAFVGRMVVGETSFFRNQAQFSALETRVLPDLIAERRREGDLRMRVWSAGCASGEEPYSIAILLATLLADWREWDISIEATDLNPFALRRAADALYSEWSFREADPEVVARFFTPVARLRRLDHPCRSLVRFRRHNLATDPIPDPAHGLADLDLIFCRNVTIYFGRELTERLAGAFFDALRPGGWLVVGHTEPDTSIYARFDAREFPDTILYARPETTDTRVAPADRRDDAPRDEPPAAHMIDEPAPATAAPRAPSTLADALAAYEARDLASAFELLHDVTSSDETTPVAPHLLAQISADETRYDEALYWAFTALQRDAFHVPTLLLMGLVFLERGDAARAKDHFDQAVYLDPACTEAHVYLSMAHRALGRDDLAERSRERASRLARSLPADAGAPLLPVQRARLLAADPTRRAPG
jgi:chemotaxis protein methyltransferase CheR